MYICLYMLFLKEKITQKCKIWWLWNLNFKRRTIATLNFQITLEILHTNQHHIEGQFFKHISMHVCCVYVHGQFPSFSKQTFFSFQTFSANGDKHNSQHKPANFSTKSTLQKKNKNKSSVLWFRPPDPSIRCLLHMAAAQTVCLLLYMRSDSVDQWVLVLTASRTAHFTHFLIPFPPLRSNIYLRTFRHWHHFEALLQLKC